MQPHRRNYLGEVVIIAAVAAMILVFSVYVALLSRKSIGSAERLCVKSCGPMRGVYLEDTCYCENQGLALVPIEQLVLDTGDR